MKNVLFLFLAFTSAAHAAYNFAPGLNKKALILQSIKGDTVRNTTDRSCLERYDDLFRDNVLNISVGFGYLDSSPGDEVYDREALTAFIFKITRPCVPGLSACGFVQTPGNPRLLTKNILDPHGVSIKAQIDVTTASLSSSAAKNNSMAPQQKAVCDAATKKFMGEIAAGAEVVFYTGHSRNGGGADFCPARLRADQHPDYEWYQANRPGRNLFMSSMKKSDQLGKANQIVGMFSCNSEKHFAQKYKSVLPQAGFIGTTATIAYNLVFDAMYGALDSVLAQRCNSSFQSSISNPETFMMTSNLFN